MNNKGLLKTAQASSLLAWLAVPFGGFNIASGAPVAALKSYDPASEVEGVHTLRLVYLDARERGV